MNRKFAIVTTTRADFDLLYPLIKELEFSKLLEPIVIASGNHFDEDFGMTINYIKSLKVSVAYEVPMRMYGDNASNIIKAMSELQESFNKLFDEIKDELEGVILLGDRFELMPIVLASSIHGIPLIHLHGGEVTEGAFDEMVRHSVTKFSELHFTSCEAHKRRVIQLGEQPDNVFDVGSLGVQNIMNMEFLTKKELESDLSIDLSIPTLLVTLHSETLESKEYQEEMVNSLLKVLEGSQFNIIFTKGNVDKNGLVINEKIEKFVDNNDNCILVSSLGAKRYFSILKHVKGVIGNSSSSIIEVPSFKVPILNIGNRQLGRYCAESIVHTSINEHDIRKNFNKMLSEEHLDLVRSSTNPYDGGNVSSKIACVLESFSFSRRKKFYDLGMK